MEKEKKPTEIIKKKRKPKVNISLTTRQKKLVDLVKKKTKNGEHFTRTEVLKEAGYVDRAGWKVFNNPRVKDALDRYLSVSETDTLLSELAKQKQLKTYTFPLDIEDKEIESILEDIWIIKKIHQVGLEKRAYVLINGQTSLPAIEMANKLRNRYAPIEHNITQNVLTVILTKANESLK